MELLSIFVSLTIPIKDCSLIRACIRKIKSNCKNKKKKSQSVNFRVLYDIIKINLFCSKDKTSTLNQSFVVYEFLCPGCSANYTVKTERTLFERNIEHLWNNKDSTKMLLTSILMNVMIFSICPILPNYSIIIFDSTVDDIHDIPKNIP